MSKNLRAIFIQKNSASFPDKTFRFLTKCCVLLLFAVFSHASVFAQCSSISSLPCPQVVKTLPFIDNFDGTEGGVADKNGVATGFTMVDRPSAPLVTPTNPGIPGYEPSKLSVSGNKLAVTSTAGLAFQNPSQNASTNSQVNALGVGFRANQKFIIQTTLLQPSGGTGKFEQAGLWFGLDEDNYVKFDVVSAGSGISQFEIVKEVGAASFASDAVKTGTMTLSSSVVQLKLIIDPAAHTIQSSYSLNAGVFVNVGTLTIPTAFTNGKLLSDGTTNNVSFAGIFTSNRKSVTPLVFNFEDFKVIPFGTGVIGVSPAKLYDNDVSGGAAGISRVITISNSGAFNLSVTGITFTGTNANQFVLGGVPAFPRVVAPNTSFTFTVAFNPTSTGLKTASISVSSNDASKPSIAIPIRALGTPGLGDGNEPSLQAILDLREIPINVGDDNSATNIINSNSALQKAPLLGEEISLQKFQKAGAGNIIIEPLAIFGPTDDNPVLGFGWYKSGNADAKSEMFTVPNSPISNGQTVNVNLTGTLSFDPSTSSFGFYTHWPFFNNRYLFSEDNLNTFSGSIPHHVRVYPLRDASGVVPNAYLVGFEEHISGFDYQDIVFIVRNVKPATQSNALLFVENPDKFPSNEYLVFSKIQTPWSRDGITYNSNHDSIVLKFNNKGISPLIISNLVLSNAATWKIEKINGVAYTPSALPVTIASGGAGSIKLTFIATNQGTRVKVLHETLTITSNDDVSPVKSVSLNGIWQNKGEGSNEPYAQEILDAFGYKTSTGFTHTDPDLGNPATPKGDEIVPSYFVRVDNTRPVSVRQMAAYHGCCYYSEYLRWFPKGTSTLATICGHTIVDGQTSLPRTSLPNNPAAGTFNPTTAFGLRIGSVDGTDATKNPGGKTGTRVWKAKDGKGNIIPNAYIISNDYLGTSATNYDYNDNMYLITNLRPETGTAFTSALGSTPSAIDFGEKVLQTNSSLQLNLSNLGQSYPNGTADPAIVISSIAITGDNKSEFSAGLPVLTTLNPQQNTTLTVNFNPISEGLKIADLLIYYNNSLSPYRVPLYGIGKLSTTTVTANFRVNSGSTTPITINGKTWSADTYSFDNLLPFANASVTSIAGTDEDPLYFKEQSSNADKKPFRYEFTLPNGDYKVRLHFAEVYWGAPGAGLSGGAGSRVMSVMLENQLRLINYDIIQDVGVTTAVIKNFPVTVIDGKLNIDFSATVNRPSVSAIEVYHFSSSSPPAVAVIADNTISLNDFERPKVFPNPLHGKFTIGFPSRYQGTCNLQISDVVGRTFQVGKILLRAGGSNKEVDISKLALTPGIYFLKIIPENSKAEVYQLIIQ